MARVFICPPEFVTTTTEADFQAYVSEVRDLFRSGLDPDNLHTNWLVTDIMRYTANGVTGCFFVVREMSGGVAQGKEFCLMWFWHASFDVAPASFFQNSTEPQNYFYRFYDNGFDQNFNFFSGFFAMHMSLNSGTVEADSYDFGFDSFAQGGYDSTIDTVTGSGAGSFIAGEVLTGGTSGALAIFVSEGADAGGTTPLTVHYVNGTFVDGENISSVSANRTAQTPVNVVKGDFSAPGTNPHTDLSAFMPTTAADEPYGVFFEGWRRRDSHQVFVCDDAKPFIACYMTEGIEPRYHNAGIMGEIVTPWEGADTERAGFMALDCFVNDFDTNTVQTNGRFFSGRYGFFGGGGGRTTFTMRWFNNLTTSNFRRSTDNLAVWDKITLDNANEVKGYIDTDIVRVMGPSHEYMYSLFNHEVDIDVRFWKMTEIFAMPWLPNVQTIPPIPWNLLGTTVEGAS